MKNELRSAGLLLLTAAIWGFAMAAQRGGSRYLQPFTFNACRFTLGAVAVLPLTLRENKHEAVPFTGRQAASGAVLGLILFIVVLIAGLSTGETITVLTVLKLIVFLIFGMLGGIAGVNKKERIHIK